MPRKKPLMAWTKSLRRWEKQYRGKRYYVSARQLNCPETKEESQEAADRWWLNEKAKIDLTARPSRPLLPLDDLAAGLLRTRPEALADLPGLLESKTNLAFLAALMAGQQPRMLENVPGLSPSERASVRERLNIGPEEKVVGIPLPISSPEFQAGLLQYLRALVGDVVREAIVTGDGLPEEIIETLPPARTLQIENAVKNIRGEAEVNTDKSIKGRIDEYVKAQQDKARAGQLSPDRADNIRIGLGHFGEYVGGAELDRIDQDLVDGFHGFLLAKIRARKEDPAHKAGWSPAYANKVYSWFTTFVRWLWERKLIELPRNLNKKGFKSGPKKITVWTVEEFKAALEATPKASPEHPRRVMRLALLFFANTGSLQKDLSDLRDDEVDWEKGMVTRKRSKTKDDPNVPTVTYQLWPETFELLKECRSETERVILTESGRPFVRKELSETGKLVKADNFASLYAHLKRKLQKTRKGFNRPLKELRKLGSSTLAKHPVYGRFSQYFLGQAPRSVAEKHYVQPPQDLFDKAVMWLGRQLGQV
jgi:integrase